MDQHDPADPSHSPPNIAHWHVDHGEGQRDRDQRPDIDHEGSIHHVLQIRIGGLGLPPRIEEDQNRPRRSHAKYRIQPRRGSERRADTAKRHSSLPVTDHLPVWTFSSHFRVNAGVSAPRDEDSRNSRFGRKAAMSLCMESGRSGG